MEIILDFLKKLPKEERGRLAAQERSRMDCRFLDMDNYRCSIYAVRPWICEAMGRVENLPCPKSETIVQIIPKIVEDMNFEREYEGGIECFSTDFDWD
jgi:Fe-S-cluster containining protein